MVGMVGVITSSTPEKSGAVSVDCTVLYCSSWRQSLARAEETEAQVSGGGERGE